MDNPLHAIFGVTGLLIICLVWFILAIMLIIAPLMIWKHAKRAANAAEADPKDRCRRSQASGHP